MRGCRILTKIPSRTLSAARTRPSSWYRPNTACAPAHTRKCLPLYVTGIRGGHLFLVAAIKLVGLLPALSNNLIKTGKGRRTGRLPQAYPHRLGLTSYRKGDNGSRLGAQLRRVDGLRVAPGPRVTKPHLRQYVHRGRFRPPTMHGYLNQQVVGALFDTLQKNVKVPIVVKNTVSSSSCSG